MNREIKFRAYDTVNKQFITLNDGSEYFIGFYFGHDGMRTIDEFIIMQYTGIKDKNSKEIYEGDILRASLEERIFICWIEYKLAGFHLVRKCEEYPHTTTISPIFGENYKSEVIGNIYENPELLEELSHVK